MCAPTIAVVLTLVSGLAACTAPHPYVRGGDANSVEVVYSGNVASTEPLATKYCAQFERAAQLADSGPDFAIYNCIRR